MPYPKQNKKFSYPRPVVHDVPKKKKPEAVVEVVPVEETAVEKNLREEFDLEEIQEKPKGKQDRNKKKSNKKDLGE